MSPCLADYSLRMAVRSLPLPASTPALAAVLRLWLPHRAWLIPAGALFAWQAALSLVQAPGGDESVYTIISSGIVDGRWPYRDLFDHKQPLLYIWYLPAGLGGLVLQRLIGAALLAASCWPMHALANRVLGDNKRAAIAVAGYAFLLANPFMMAASNAEAYLLLPLLGAFVAPTALLAGALFGLAVVSKGLALVFLPVLLVRWRRDCWGALAGAGAVVGITALAFAPVWRDAFDANVAFNHAYATYAGERLVGRLLVDPWVLLASLPVWLAMVVGMVVFRDRLAWALFICGMLYVKASPFDFAHYYAMLAPGAAVFAGAGIAALLSRPDRSGVKFAAAGIAAVACLPAAVLFALSFGYQATHTSPYADVAAGARRIDGDVYVLGSAPQIYIQASRTPQHRFFFTPPLAVRERWGQETRAALVACPPGALVVPDDDVFTIEWTDDVTALYNEEVRYAHATMYSQPAQPCTSPAQ